MKKYPTYNASMGKWTKPVIVPPYQEDKPNIILRVVYAAIELAVLGVAVGVIIWILH